MGSICIRWEVILTFFWAHLPVTFVVDRLEYKWIGTQRRRIFELRLQVRRVSGKASSPVLFPLYLWNAHDRVKWDEKKYVPDKLTKHSLKMFKHSDIYLKHISNGSNGMKIDMFYTNWKCSKIQTFTSNISLLASGPGKSSLPSLKRHQKLQIYFKKLFHLKIMFKIIALNWKFIL